MSGATLGQVILGYKKKKNNRMSKRAKGGHDD